MEQSQTVASSSMKSTTAGKDSKKDRHMKLIQEFSKFLEVRNESTVQEVLLLRRSSRELLESLDEDLQKFCARIDVDSFLLDKSEDNLITYLNELKHKIQNREDSISKLQYDLDDTEVRKSNLISTELKTLVDKLIAIGHQLPDDIQRFVENEAYEINKDVIKTRVEHAQFVANLRITHVQLEFELIEKWEATRRKWRQLRHDQALNGFRKDITSEEYNNPNDRKKYMEQFRAEQSQRRAVIQNILQEFQQLNYSTMTIDQITELQQKLTTCNEIELAAVQECYNGLTSLRSTADYLAKERAEALRKELHVYGALKIPPKLHITAKKLENVLNDESLNELFRLGGGLKQDFQLIIQEMTCDEIVYNRVVVSMKEKLELITCSFSLKGILEEKGRLIQLDKIRNMITKLRNSPRAEIPNLLKTLTPELDEVSKMDKIPPLFMESITGILKEIEEEFIALDKRILQSKMISGGTSLLGTANGTKLMGSQSIRGLNTAGPAATSAAVTTATSKPITGNTSQKTLDNGNTKARTSQSRTKRGGTSGPGATSAGGGSSSTVEIMTYVDPILLKAWHRKLAILFYGSDLPATSQELLLEIYQQALLQYECNEHVDAVIHTESNDQIRVMDLRYGQLIDKISLFLEQQTNYLFTQSMNISNFYFQIAAFLEKHRTEQKALDNKSADELWDLSEDFRFQLEDLENEYQKYCQQIRESTKQEEINENFEQVLNVLDRIQESYRIYHKNACFAADRYPLYLINEFRNILMLFAKHFFMHPKASHHIFQQYHRLFDLTQRLNATFFENDPLVLGFPRIEDDEIFENANYSSEIFISPNGENEDDYESLGAFSGSFHLLIEFTNILTKFNEDSFFKFTHPSQQQQQSEGANNNNPENPEEEIKPILTVGFTPHAQYPFLKEETTITPKTPEEIEALLPEDREEYEKLLIKFFLPIQDLSKLTTPEEIAAYETMKEYVEKLKERIAHETSFEYVRSHIPREMSVLSDGQEGGGNPWIQLVEVTPSELTNLFTSIRGNVISLLETEAFKKIIAVEHDMNNKKTELTNQLEDRIRNHWPRRGRVETEIKQPRENELLSHKDKTYRIVINLQNKMMEIQSKFYHLVALNEKENDQYKNEIHSLMNLLHNNYKNLATLTGIDVKARQITLDFQQENQKKINSLMKILSNDVNNQIANVKEFRKICPPQQKGMEGGYSEQELQEIEILITNQVNEIIELRDHDWTQQISDLQILQTNSLKIYDEFQLKYAKCVQEVAMAEGLGQKYGAPRRRAQERIRTEISLDEKKNFKIDEFLSQIEFLANEIHVSGNNDGPLFEESTFSSIPDGNLPTGNIAKTMKEETLALTNATNKRVSFENTAAGAGNHGNNHQQRSIALVSQGIDNIKNLHLMWTLMKVLKDLMMKRVTFLNVIGENGYPMTVEQLLWIAEQRYYELNELIPSANNNNNNTNGNANAQTAVVHAEHFLETMKEIETNVIQNSIIVQAIPTEKKDSPRGPPGGGGGAGNVKGGGVMTLEIVYEEINQNCRKETKQLYESEGLLSILQTKTGVPESLENWLTESHAKIFGDKGYREKAWKRLWAQVEKLDLLLVRNRNLSQDQENNHHSKENDHKKHGNNDASPSENNSPMPSTKKKTERSLSPSKTHAAAGGVTMISSNIPPAPKMVSIQSAIFYYYTKSMILFSQNDYQMKYHELEKLLKIWDKSKDKNERLLRPKLASPDRQDELTELDNLELSRSSELISTTILFRNLMIRKQIIRFRTFIDDLIQISKGLINFIDSIIRLELMALPPDTEIPKKHMTLKKLRKAQRIREEIAKGGVDRSKKRMWPAIELQEICDLIKANEDLVSDLGKDPSDLTGGIDSSNAPTNEPAAAGGGDKNKKAPPAKKGTEKGAALIAETATPSLVPQVWIDRMKEISLVEGLVSSAQRVVIEERILSLQRYTEYLKYFFSFMREEFSKIIKQEESWNERWKRQVEMLRKESQNAATASKE